MLLGGIPRAKLASLTAEFAPKLRDEAISIAVHIINVQMWTYGASREQFTFEVAAICLIHQRVCEKRFSLGLLKEPTLTEI